MNEDGEIRLSSISKADSYEAIGEFWDTQSLADYWDQGHDVEIEVNIPRRHRVAIEAETFERIAAESRQRGILPETLINMWLAERLQATHSGSRAPRRKSKLKAVAEAGAGRSSG
jgi:hypothetical protein